MTEEKQIRRQSALVNDLVWGGVKEKRALDGLWAGGGVPLKDKGGGTCEW